MPDAWSLTPPTPEHLAVLAACWAVPAQDLADRGRRWVQATDVGDARGPRVVDLADRTVTVLAAPGADNPRWVPRFTGLRGLLHLPARAAGPEPGVRPVSAADAALAEGLLARCSQRDRDAASPHPRTALLAVGVEDGGRLTGLAAVVGTPAGPPEVSVLVDPQHRRRGLSLRLERSLVALAGGRWPALQHRTVAADTASQRLAARCGFALVSVEHLVRPA